jgi:hypothetical protein
MTADELITRHMAGLDDDALDGIIEATSAQADFLSRRENPPQSRILGNICGLVSLLAEQARIQRLTGVVL